MGKNKAQTHRTSTYETRIVSSLALQQYISQVVGRPIPYHPKLASELSTYVMKKKHKRKIENTSAAAVRILYIHMQP